MRAPRFAFRAWGAEVVVYDEFTGATHLLGPWAPAIWRLLADGGATEEIRSFATPLAATGNDALTPDEAEQILAKLEALGLVSARSA